MNKKVLILSMTGGFGHIRAGDALLDYAKEHIPGAHVEHVNVIDIDESLKKYTADFYDMISKKFPFVWNVVYRYLPASLLKKVVGLRGVFNKKIEHYIRDKNPDMILCTNVVILSMLPPHFKEMFPDIKIGVTVTDYQGHPYYAFPFLDYYFVATIDVGYDLEKLGIKKEKIVVSGIPINPRFYIKENIGELKLKYGIKNGNPVVLFIASFKISKKDLVLTVKKLLEFAPKVNVICIANGNDVFYRLVKDSFVNESRLLLVHWTNVIEEYMKISDVVISKAGGLTVSECVSLKKPIIMVHPIPGQEEYNAEFVEKNNFGIRVKNVNHITDVLTKMISLSKNNQMALWSPENPCEKIFKYMLR